MSRRVWVLHDKDGAPRGELPDAIVVDLVKNEAVRAEEREFVRLGKRTVYVLVRSAYGCSGPLKLYMLAGDFILSKEAP